MPTTRHIRRNLRDLHNLFLQVSSDALPQIAPVVEAYAKRHGLPYRSFSPWQLAKEHFAFLSPQPAAQVEDKSRHTL